MTRLDRGQIGKANSIDITVKSSRGLFRALAQRGTWSLDTSGRRCRRRTILSATGRSLVVSQ